MRKYILLMIAFLIVSLPALAVAAPLDNEISSIFSGRRLSSADYSVYAVSFPGEKVLTEINKDEPLNPASCMKLLTTAAALKHMGPDYRFPTKFYLVKNGTETDLWVKGYGDPAFVIERLEEVVSRLIRAKLPINISNIYIDDSYFADGDFPGRQGRGKSNRSYNALTGAVSLNHSATTIEVFPANKVGAPAIVKSDSPAVSIKNLAKTSAKRSRGGISVKKARAGSGEEYIVSGNIRIGSAPKKQHFSVKNPAIHFGESLKGLLTASGINVRGNVAKAIVPKEAPLFFEEKSQPLSELIKEMNKRSSNFRAEQLTKALGAKYYGEPGTTEKGVLVMSEYLSSIGGTSFMIENGSGLSYKNQMTASDLLMVMKDMYKDPGLSGIFLDSLSIAGIDGTLKKWKNTPLAGVLKGKTGSLNGVSTLAGFLPDRKGAILFVVFLNGSHIDFGTGRNASQKIAETLMR